MRLRQGLGFGCGALFLLIGAAVFWAVITKPWVLPVEMTNPSPFGKRIVAHGITGNFYPASHDRKWPGILIFGGSEGGLSTPVARHARALNAAGYPVFHFAWWRGPGQTQRIDKIPIENFDRALAWLKAQAGVDPSRIAVFGWSRGSEAAQLLALRHPEIRLVVLGMPANAIWPGFDWNFLNGMPKYAWAAGGRPYPRVPDRALTFSFGKAWSKSEFDKYRHVLAQDDRSLIPVERIRASVLMICGEADAVWPSCPMARALLARAQQHGKRNVTLLAYRGAGHMGYGAPAPDGDPRFARQVGVGGGDVASNQKALKDSFAATLAALDAQLEPHRR